MDFYSLDKHCPSILSPPVISSTSSVPDTCSNDNSVYLNGGSYRNSGDSCMSTSHSFNGHGHGNIRHENVKMANIPVDDGDLFGGNGFSSYYNLSGHGPLHHQPQSQLEDLKKGHISFHQMQSTPVYTNISCSMSVDSQASLYHVKEEFESSMYSMQQCTPQSSTSPILSLPDSPPIVSSNSGFHSTGNRHSMSPNSQRNMCVAKKSSTNCYELKREMAESSGLSLSGAPYPKSRAGRKGAQQFCHFCLCVCVCVRILSPFVHLL